MTIGKRIRALRHKAGRTLENCAHAAGWARASSWADVEKDRRQPNLRTISTVARVLGLPMSSLLEGVG